MKKKSEWKGLNKTKEKILIKKKRKRKKTAARNK
jgi:hypothetical protein